MKKGLIKKIFMSGLVGVMALGLVSCSSGNKSSEGSSVMNSIKEKGKVVVGLSADYAPYEFHIIENGEDKIVGFDINLAEEIAKELGVKLEIKEMDFDSLITALPAGKIDLIISGMNPTPKRAEAVDFSEIYYTSQHGILVRAEDADKYKTFADLNGKKVGAQLGSTQAELAGELIENADLQLLANVNNLIIELKTGKVDALVMELPVAKLAVQSNPELAVGEEVYEDEGGGNAVAVKKGNEDLVEEVNKVIEKLTSDGSMDKFIQEAIELAPQAVEE